MDAKSQQSKRRDNVLSSLEAVIQGLTLAESLSSITPAKAVFSTIGVILTMIRDSMANEVEYVELGLTCNTVCTALDRGLRGKQLDELSGSVLEAISQLTTAAADIRSKIAERSKQNAIARAFHAKNDCQAIAGWRMDLNRILLVFNTELGLNIYVIVSDVRDGVTKAHTAVAEVQRDVADTHAMVSDIRRAMMRGQEGADDQRWSTHASTLGESPPPAPRACFGRDELIENIVGLVEDFTPVALIGAGGIGKTSIALTVLHHDRIKQRFGDNRRFIRCDQFTTSCAHFLSRLSKVIGAGIENPEDFAALRPFMSSKAVFIVLDNAESILDPQGMDAQEIYAVVEELSQLDNVWLCVTSRISTIPPDCETFDVPTLSIEAARDAFYRICKNGKPSNLVDDVLGQLDFHPLSITLLATVAHHNRWDTDRLAREWERRRTSVLQTKHNKSLADTIELSLASPLFQELGPDARALLEVVAFLPQGVDENNLEWLFPTIPNGASILDNFCILSLTYRSNGFIMMLAPLRDYLSPKDPKSCPLLCKTKECYFTRVSVCLNPNKPEFGESRWIVSEDVNVEHLINIFTSIDTESDDAWKACIMFIRHLYWHKIRVTVLGPKIEGLPDDHRSKPDCLFELSQLFDSVGDHPKCKQLLSHALQLQREEGNELRAARTLRHLSEINRQMGLHEEGIRLAKEASGIYERLGDMAARARCLRDLAWLLCEDNQLDTAEEAASRAIELLRGKDEQYLVCGSHRILGNIHRSKGERDRAIHHFEVALGIASSFNWLYELFQVHSSLAQLFLDEGRFDDTRVHVERAKSHAADHAYYLGRAMVLQARLWYKQRKLEEARSEALYAADVFETLGAAKDVKDCRELLRDIQKELSGPIASDSNSQGTEQ